MPRIATITLLVPDYDAALAFFVGGLGWTCTADINKGRKRWVTITPDPRQGATLLLAQASTPGQADRIGTQVGDSVGFFLETEDFERDTHRITAAGGTFLEAPRQEAYGRVVQWRDPFGNLWDLLQPT